jgi:hypothetical protein
VLAATGTRGRLFLALCGVAVLMMGLEIAVIHI